MQIFWEWKTFQDFTDPFVLYRVLQLRQQVFIVEQQSLYHDLDDKDQAAMHLLGWITVEENKTLAMYARLLLPMGENAVSVVSFGRVAVDKRFRGLRLGEQLVSEILKYLGNTPFNKTQVVISAQYYLIAFYRKFGFETVGEPYDEDGVLHIDMILT